jgi:hypothetical protein
MPRAPLVPTDLEASRVPVWHAKGGGGCPAPDEFNEALRQSQQLQ